MSSHHDHHDNHSKETKPVAFRTPLILGLVTLLAIVLLVSTCDKKHGCCEEEETQCEGHAKKECCEAPKEHSEKDAIEKMKETIPVVTDTIAKADTAHVVEHVAH